MQKVRVGTIVSWVCKPYIGAPVGCIGRVVKLVSTTFGAQKEKPGAKIQILAGYPFPNRKFTTVAMDKLKYFDKAWEVSNDQS